MKICMITTVHAPLDQRIFHKESKSLLNVGHSVTIIAPDDDKYTKQVDGIYIKTIKRAKKIFHPLTMVRVFLLGLKQDCDVYHCHEPGSLLVCSLLKIIKRKKLVYDAHEHYALLIATNPIFPKILQQIIYKISDVGEKFLTSTFPESVITVDEILGNKFREICTNVWIISNYPKIELFEDTHLKTNIENKNLIYVGGLTEERGIMEIILAFENVLKKIPDAKLLFVGGFYHQHFKSRIMDYYHKQGLEKNIDFVGQVPYSKVAGYMKEANVAISVLQPNGRYELGISVKFYEYMCAGLPIVINNFKYMKQLAEEIKCGIPVNPTDIKEISNAIIWFFEHPKKARQMGENGRRAAENCFSWEIMEKRLAKMYDEIQIN